MELREPGAAAGVEVASRPLVMQAWPGLEAGTQTVAAAKENLFQLILMHRRV